MNRGLLVGVLAVLVATLAFYVIRDRVLQYDRQDPPIILNESIVAHDDFALCGEDSCYRAVQIVVPIEPGKYPVWRIGIDWATGDTRDAARAALNNEQGPPFNETTQGVTIKCRVDGELIDMPPDGISEPFDAVIRLDNYLSRGIGLRTPIRANEVVAFSVRVRTRGFGLGNFGVGGTTRGDFFEFTSRPTIRIAVFRHGYYIANAEDRFLTDIDRVREELFAGHGFENLRDRVEFVPYFEPELDAVTQGVFLGNFVQAQDILGNDEWDVMLALGTSAATLRLLGFTRQILHRRGITKSVARADYDCGFPDTELSGDVDELFDKVWEHNPRIANVISRSGQLFPRLAVHELAHAIASIEDEYTSGPPATLCAPETPRHVNPDAHPLPPNVVALNQADASQAESYWPWAHRISDNATLPTPSGSSAVGGHPGGAYTGPDETISGGRKWYRSERDCRMIDGQGSTGFCFACRQAIIYMLRHRLGREDWDIGLRYHYSHFAPEDADL